MLTAQGMRQRTLLGSYTRQRYMEELGFLEPDYNPLSFYIQSTDIPRTL